MDYTRRVTLFSQIRFQYQNRGSLCIAFQSFRPSIHSYWQRLLQRGKWSTNSIIFCQNYVRNRADQANKAYASLGTRYSLAFAKCLIIEFHSYYGIIALGPLIFSVLVILAIRCDGIFCGIYKSFRMMSHATWATFSQENGEKCMSAAC